MLVDLVFAGSFILAGSGEGAIALVLAQFMAVLVPVVFVAVSATRGNLMAAFLFVRPVAVGLTPELLALVINACLAKGVRAMGRRETIVLASVFLPFFPTTPSTS